MSNEEAQEVVQSTHEIPQEYINAEGKILGRYDDVRELINDLASGEVERPVTESVESPTPTEAAPTSLPPGDLKIEATSEATAAGADQLVDLYQEYQQHGGLTDQRYQELQSQGFNRAAVDMMIEGQTARRELAKQRVANAVGGEEAISRAFAWASANMEAAQVDAINADLASASVDGQAAIIRGLIQQSGAIQGNFASGQNAPVANAPFSSRQQMLEAMSDPRYKNDPAYQSEVMSRVSASRLS